MARRASGGCRVAARRYAYQRQLADTFLARVRQASFRVSGMLRDIADGSTPHFDSPQFRQVMQLSIMTTAAVLHLPHNCAPSGKCDFENASCWLLRASNSARLSSISFF